MCEPWCNNNNVSNVSHDDNGGYKRTIVGCVSGAVYWGVVVACIYATMLTRKKP